jgi:hypothetical protein
MTKENYAARIEICNNCEVFNTRYKTCGPPTNAINPFAKPTQLNGVTFKPCGCPIDHLAMYAVKDCPAKKWPILDDRLVIENMLAFIESLKRKNQVTSQDMKVVGELRKKYTKLDYPGTSCGPCAKKYVDDVEQQLISELTKLESAQALIELTNLELTPEPIQKKRRAKRKKL